jgi:PASTA domain
VIRHAVRAGLALIAVAALVAPAAASAKPFKVPGSAYDVTFKGTGSADLTQTVHTGERFHAAGRWDVVDDHPAQIVIPAVYDKREEAGELQQSPTLTEPVPGSAQEVAEPTTLAIDGAYLDGDGNLVDYSCQVAGIYNNGVATVSAAVGLQKFVVATSWANPGRGFDTGATGDAFRPNTVSCSPDFPAGFALGSGYGPDGTTYYTGPEYATTVPFSNAGKKTFTLPAKDQSQIAPCTPGPDDGDTCSGPDFHLTGTYTFTKTCDGLITYPDATIECLAAGSAAKCIVPKLKGKKLAGAKSALQKAHCALGAVKHKKSKKANKGRVIAQSVAPGKHLKKGSKVGVTLGK